MSTFESVAAMMGEDEARKAQERFTKAGFKGVELDEALMQQAHIMMGAHASLMFSGLSGKEPPPTSSIEVRSPGPIPGPQPAPLPPGVTAPNPNPPPTPSKT